MSDILTRPVVTDTDNADFVDFPVSIGEMVDAVISDPTFKPFTMMMTNREIWEQSPEGQRRQYQSRRQRNRRRRNQGIIAPDEDFVPPAMLTAKQANEKYKHLNLNFDQPISVESAKIIAKGKEEEFLRNDVLARGPTGFIPGAIGFGAAMVASVIDPINFASIFVPGVSQARFARMVSIYGRTSARLAAGAFEGTVSTIALEPIIHTSARNQQLDYDMTNSLYSIAAGAGFGAGLHAGFGKIGDFLRARGVEFNIGLNRASVFQALVGKQVETEPMARQAVRDPVNNSVARRRQEVNVEEGDELFDEGALLAAKVVNPNTGEIVVNMSPRQFLELSERLDDPDPEVMARLDEVIENEEQFLEIPTMSFKNDGKGNAVVTSQDGRKRALALEARGIDSMPVRLKSEDGGGGQKIRFGPDSEDALPNTIIGENGDSQFRFPLAREEDGTVVPRPMHDDIGDTQPGNTLEDDAQRMADHMERPETDSVGDYEGASAKDEEIQNTHDASLEEAQKELDGLTDELRIMVRDGIISPEDFDEITNSFDELDLLIDNMGRGADAAAICMAK